MVHWSPSPEIVSIGSFSIRWYGLLFALGFLGCYFVERWIFKREGKSLKALDDLFLYTFFGVVIGARLGHVLFYDPGYYLSNPVEVLKVWRGGLASHGALAGVLVALVIFVRTHHEFGYLWLLDRMSVAAPLGAACVRIGNLFNSEIYGKPTSVPWAFVFARVDAVPRHPTQLYEAASSLVTLLILVALYRREPLREREGFLFGSWLLVLFLARFLIEFVKEPQSAFEVGLPINMGQILSIAPIVAGVVLMVRALLREGGRCPSV
jgi:prolipoprotein diacylglyceryl transferase